MPRASSFPIHPRPMWRNIKLVNSVGYPFNTGSEFRYHVHTCEKQCAAAFMQFTHHPGWRTAAVNMFRGAFCCKKCNVRTVHEGLCMGHDHCTALCIIGIQCTYMYMYSLKTLAIPKQYFLSNSWTNWMQQWINNPQCIGLCLVYSIFVLIYCT